MALDYSALERRLVQELALIGSGTAAELRARLGVSQPTFSRLVARMGERVLSAGRASATRYAARRAAQDLPLQLPIYEIGVGGRAGHLAELHAILPEGFYVESKHASVASAFHRDLPYFLHDLRPAGFLGRLLPPRHPELELPADVRLWSSNDVLRYVSRFGVDLPGSLIIGEQALERYLALAAAPRVVVAPRQRSRRYPELALEVLERGAPGSSAGGEQPKFLTTREPDVEVLVKFSSREKSASSRRGADLLLCEHLALQTLAEHGEAASRSELVLTPEQVFLEVERFDRLAGGGRSGVLSLFALDAEYLGRMKNWTDSVVHLAQAGHVPQSAVASTQRRELFGKLIGNSDMHPGNLSFMAQGARVTELAPVYDMLPMHYAGVGREATGTVLSPPTPSASDADVWDVASRAALSFWNRVSQEPEVSSGFRKLARQNAASVDAYRGMAERLPARRA